MAWDLLLRRETDTNWARNPAASLELSFSPAEMKALKLLEPSTRTHVVEVIGWARNRGIPAKLYTQGIIYTPEVAAKHYAEGRSGIAPGRLDWHQVGRAYHLIIIDPETKKRDQAAYAVVGKYVRSQGGEWLGDKTIFTPKGPMQDLAHYEYHPDFDIATYRKMPLAQAELRAAQSRAKKYG
jgi:hypothetical protein